MKDHLKAMAVHAPALVPGWHIRQSVGSLKTKTTPDVGMITMINVCPFIARTLNSNRIQPRKIE
jgi:hypothetical protein